MRGVTFVASLIAAVGPLGAPALAQDRPAEMVADLWTTPEPRDSNPREITVSSTHVFAVADIDNHGDEVVAADRATGAVTLRIDFEPGGAGSSPRLLTLLGDAAVFEATQTDGGRALWMSDGTAAGTLRRWQIDDGVSGSAGWCWAVVSGGRLFVALSSGGLWVSDDGGASFVQLTAAGARHPVAFSAGVVFWGTDEAHGAEPWVSDGTAAGTSLVTDIRPGPESSAAPWVLEMPEMVAALGAVYFAADDDGVSGSELWCTDGTPGGTRLVFDAWPWSYSLRLRPQRFGEANGLLYFASGGNGSWEETRELWRTDGTSQGTMLLRADSDLSDEEYRAPGPSVVLGSAGGRVLLSDGVDVVATDGTPEGTLRVMWGTSDAVHPGACAVGTAGGRVVFAANGTLGVSDGTPAGTTWLFGYPWPDLDRRSEFYPGPFDQWSPWGPVAIRLGASDGTVYFPDGEVYETDGTRDGTRLAMNLADDGGSGGSDPVPFGVLPGYYRYSPPELVFSALGDDVGREPFVTNGYSTSLLRDVYPGDWGSDPVFMGSLGGRILFSADDGPHGREPWITNGYSAMLLEDVQLGPGGSHPYSTGLVVSGRLIFFADDGVHGFEPWSTDGTPDGTQMLRDILPGNLPRSPEWGQNLHWGWSDGERRIPAARLGHLVAFLVPDDALPGDLVWPTDGFEYSLWSTDGTPTGTQRVVQVGRVAGVVVPPTVGGGLLRFVALTSGRTSGARYRDRLWTWAGAPVGARSREILLGDVSDVAGASIALGRGAGVVWIDGWGTPLPAEWFPWTPPLRRTGLVFLDPTARGRPVTWLDERLGSIDHPIRLGDRALFTLGADQFLRGDPVRPARDRELWVSDGRSRGTRRLVGTFRAPLGQVPLGATGLAAFSASDPGTGHEAWFTDGTEAGTRRVADVRPGPESSAPSDFALLGDFVGVGTRLVFAADDGTNGRELWAVEVGGLPHEDRDGDGTPDVLGYFPDESSPGVPTTTDDLVIERLDATLDVAGNGADRLSVRGWWDPPGSVRLARGDVQVSVAGTVGAARPAVRRAPHGGARVRFRVQFREFRGARAGVGLGATAAAAGGELRVPVAVRWGNHLATTARTVRVTMRGGRARWRLSR